MIKIALNILVAMLLLFVCSVPIARFAALSVSGSIILKTIRLLLVIAISLIIRGKSREALDQNKSKRGMYVCIIIGFICASVCLHFSNATPWLYGVVSTSIGIYSERTPPFLTILWEQLFAGDLYWSILLSLVIVFFDVKRLVNKQGL